MQQADQCWLTAAPHRCSPATSPDVKRLIKCMVERDPRRRIKMEDICQQPWVAQVGATAALPAPHGAMQLSAELHIAQQGQGPQQEAFWCLRAPVCSPLTASQGSANLKHTHSPACRALTGKELRTHPQQE